MKRIITALTLMVAMIVPAAASAHHATGIDIDISCVAKSVVSRVGYVDFGGGHYILVSTEIKDTLNTFQSEGLDGSGTLRVPPVDLVGYSGTVTVTAQAKFPDGRPENEPVVVTKAYDCPRPPAARYRPDARIIGPCWDPIYGVWYNNTRSNRPVTFKLKFNKYGVGMVTRQRTVPAGKKYWSGWKHVKGSTIITVTARGKVLARERAAPPGNYGACTKSG